MAYGDSGTRAVGTVALETGCWEQTGKEFAMSLCQDPTASGFLTPRAFSVREEPVSHLSPALALRLGSGLRPLF